MIRFPKDEIAIRNTYWGATDKEVRESEKWEPDPQSYGGDYNCFNGYILESPCHLCYRYSSINGERRLIEVSYYFGLYSAELYNNLLSILGELYGEVLDIVKLDSEEVKEQKKPKIWLTDDDLTSVEIIIDEWEKQKCIRIYYRYNGEGVRKRITDYRKQTMSEFSRQFIAIYHHDYQDKWYWVLHTPGGALRISPCDNRSEELCRQRIEILQSDGSLPQCRVISGGPQTPPNYKNRPMCDE